MAPLPAVFGPLQGASGGGSPVELLLILALAVLIIGGFWRTFQKAGEPGWAAIVPFYNFYVLLRISGNPGWWLILAFIPVVNLLVALKVGIDVAENFGKGTLFGLGLTLLSFIFYPILGFGDASYRGST